MNSNPPSSGSNPATEFLSRRELLNSLLALSAVAMTSRVFGAAASPSSAQPATRDGFGELLPQRKLGRKGPMVTMLGMGGAHIGSMDTDALAQKTIETAIAGGVRFFETAAGYSQGRSEVRYGQLLTPKYRDVIFLATKTQTSDPAKARRDLDMSLSRMKTDYLDLWHMHSLHSPEDADKRIENGVLDVLLEAKAKGKVRHIGFTGHVTPDAHLRMLARGAEKGDPFTACQMPINVLDPSYHSFILNYVPKAVEAGVGVLAMKTLAFGAFFGRNQPANSPKLIPDRLSVAEALSFVWSLPVSVLVTGADNPEMLQEKIDLARKFQAMDESQRKALIAKVADLAGPTLEWYKVPPRG
jgi:predicted aldo/keto reductase-like oxidoreductase